MTKRVLSMLMALIMALSLCVPAFAADEPVSADEPATEVEAPAAEAEEIEAEEVEAEAEPVDEPAEVAVDEPETAAVDEPLLVALGVVTKEAHWALKKAVDAAEALLPDVEAGKLRLGGGSAVTITDKLEDYIEDPVKNDPFKDETVNPLTKKSFAETLAEAKVILEGVDGKEVDVNVTTTTVQDAANALNYFVGDTVATALTTKIAATGMDATTIGEELKTLSESAYSTKTPVQDALPDITFDGKTDVTTSAVWKKAYQPNYLTALQKAINDVIAYGRNRSKTYSDYKSLIYTIMDALALQEAAAKPVPADMTRVDAVLAKAPAKTAYTTHHYVLDPDQSGWDAFKALVDAVTDLKGDSAQATTAFKSSKFLWDVNDAVTALANHEIEIGKSTIKLADGYGEDQEKTATVKFTITSVAGNTVGTAKAKMDGYSYGILWRVKTEGGEYWFDKSNENGKEYKAGAALPTDLIQDLFSGFDVSCTQWTLDPVTKSFYYASGALKPIGASATAKFNEDDVVTVYIFRNKGTAANKVWEQVTSDSFTIGPATEDEEVAWPTIKSVEYAAFASTAGSVTKFGTTDSFFGASKYDATKLLGGFATNGKETGAKITITLNAEFDIESNKDKGDLWVVIKDSNKKVIFTSNELTTGTGETIVLQAGTSAGQFDDSALKAGTYIVELHTCKNDEMALGVSDIQSTAKLQIGALADWTVTGANQPENIESVLVAAEKLIPSDYEISEDHKIDLSATTDEGKLTQAFELIQKNIDGIRALLNDTTAGSTMTNHNNAVNISDDNATCLQKLLTVIGYLTKKPAEMDEMNQLLAEATNEYGASPENEGTGKYTFDSRGRLKDAIDAATKVKNAGATGALQSQVDAATAALKAALDGLVELADIDKSELEASIAAAEALNEEDYTPESWADLEDALTEAKNVLADEDATQAQLTNAADKLNKAVAALVKDVDADDLAAAIEAAEAAIADPSKYTDESVKAVQDAITAAEALGDDATADEIADAIDKLDAAVKGLVPAEAEPELKEGWNLIEGEYYYCKDGKMVKSDWVKSKGLWYHMGADGTMDTGFIHIVDDWGDGWYYLEESNDKGTQGRMRTGWWEVNDELTGQWGWFETRSNGHQGMCTYTTNQGDYKDYKPVK